MKTYSVPIRELKMKSRRDKYPRGANAPTTVTKYKCLCGWGKIVEYDTRGFNDHFVTLKCRRCLKKYHPFIDIFGYEFMFYLLEKDKT